MAARKEIVLALPTTGVNPQFRQQQRQQQPQQAATTQFQRPIPEPGQSSGGSDVEEITRAEFRRSQGYHLIRIEEPEEDIDPMFRNAIRSLNGWNSAPVRRPHQAHGHSSRAKGSRQ